MSSNVFMSDTMTAMRLRMRARPFRPNPLRQSELVDYGSLRLSPLPDRRSGLDRRREARGGRRIEDAAGAPGVLEQLARTDVDAHELV